MELRLSKNMSDEAYETEVRKIFDEVDENNDGVLQFEEFKNFL